MRFGGTFRHIIRRLLLDDSRLDPVYLGKAELADAYTWLWVLLKDTPSVALLIPRKNNTTKQSVGFPLSLPMGYIDSYPFFCMSTETIVDMVNASIGEHHCALPHPVDMLADKPAPKERSPKQDKYGQWMKTPP